MVRYKTESHNQHESTDEYTGDVKTTKQRMHLACLTSQNTFGSNTTDLHPHTIRRTSYQETEKTEASIRITNCKDDNHRNVVSLLSALSYG